MRQPVRPREVPRRMRPPDQRVLDQRLGPQERYRAIQQMQTGADAEVRRQRHEAFARPRNQIAELPRIAAEMTPIPSAMRAHDAYERGDWRNGNFEAFSSGLNAAGWFVGGRPNARPGPRVATGGPDMVDLARSVNRGFTQSDQNFLASMASDEMPTPEQALGRPLTPDHIWNDPRFNHRLAMTPDLEGVQAPVDRFRIAGERIEASLPPARTNDLDVWRGDRAAQLPELIRRQRSLDGSYGGVAPDNSVPLEDILDVARNPETARVLPDALGEYLGHFGVGGSAEHAPLLGSPDINMDPMFARRPPGALSRERGPPRMPSEDRYLFGRLPPQAPTPPRSAMPGLGARLLPGMGVNDRSPLSRLRGAFDPSVRNRTPSETLSDLVETPFGVRRAPSWAPDEWALPVRPDGAMERPANPLTGEPDAFTAYDRALLEQTYPRPRPELRVDNGPRLTQRAPDVGRASGEAVDGVTPNAPDGGAASGSAVARQDRTPFTPMDRLLRSPGARDLHAQDATILQVPGTSGRMDTVYDFRDSASRSQVFFRPESDGETFAITMSASGARPDSPMSVKVEAFANAISAIEHHALRNNARRRGLRYIFAGESDAHTRLFRGLAERSTWPNGAVIHDTPGGFEISFDPSRAPFSRTAEHDYAFSPEAAPNLGQDGAQLQLSETINSRSRQIAEQRRLALDAPNGSPPRPPDQSKSYRSHKPPSGGFLLPRRR
jgi:hypothetical protein